MKDIIITNVIPKTHKSVLLFLLFTFFLGFFIFITLLEGLSINRFTLGGVKVEKLYLKWDNSLHIQAEKLDFSAISDTGTPTSIKPLSKLPKIMRWTESWVDSIQVNIIQYKEIKASLKYQKHHVGIVTLEGLKFSKLEGNFDLNSTNFHFRLPSTKFKNGDLNATVDIDLIRQTLRSDLSLFLHETPPLHVTFLGDTDRLHFSAYADAPLTTIKPLVDSLDLDPQIVPWITEYATASSLHLQRIEGTYHYDNPEELIKNLVIDATVISGTYAFVQSFEPIRAPQIDLHFRNGKLYIYPKDGTFYSLPTEQSHLYIDFTTPHVMLNATIRTDHAKLNNPILSLLEFYGIHLPLKQIKGECAVDLNLSVNLYDFSTVAKGTFAPSSSDILLDAIALKTEGGIVRVDQNKVTFDNFTAHYGDNIAHAHVGGLYDAHTGIGTVSIDAYAFSPLKGLFSLYNTNDPLHILYTIAPKGDFITVKKSQWKLFNERLNVEPFQAPFDYHRAHLSINKLPFTLSDKIKGSLDALFNGANKEGEIQLHLKPFKFGEVELQQTPFDLDLHYSNKVANFTVKNASSWSFHQLPVLISPFNGTLDDTKITFDDIETVLGDLFKGNFSGKYRINDNAGLIHLNNMVPISLKMVPIIDKKESLDLILDTKEDSLKITAPSLKAHFSTITNGWKIDLDDISLLSKKSPILRKYNINNGYLNIYYMGESGRYDFNGEIDYLYPLMLINDIPLSHYRFVGSHQKDTSTIRVNDRLSIRQTPDSIFIRANNAGLNLPALFKFLSAHTDIESATQKEPSPPIKIDGTNSYLYLMKGRKIITDTFSASLYDDHFDASLQHMGGTANLKIRNDLFSIEGEGFNDSFMEHLFALSDFSGGHFSFQAKGKSDSFDGIMRVEKTILRDYKVLNNVLAFVNTVPSLTTFSLPNYNSKGLPVEEGYTHFTYQKGIFSVDNFTINSPEIKIMGSGRADIRTELLDGTLTLKTDLGSAFGKIPMVGYILLGDDGSLSTTLTLSGKLDNPKVDTAIAKEIVTAPFNILKRTLVYPFLWMMDDKKPKQ